jgi:hypothetical protein
MRRFVLGAALSIGVALAVVWLFTEMSPMELGPVDGHDLPPTDLERVAVGSEAPDFTLRAFPEGAVTLSDYRGQRDVVLVFYRGHW